MALPMVSLVSGLCISAPNVSDKAMHTTAVPVYHKNIFPLSG